MQLGISEFVKHSRLNETQRFLYFRCSEQMIDNLHDAIDGESLDPIISREKAQELENRLISLGVYLKDSGRAAFCCSGYTAHYRP